ncbi:hypothetical protein [Halorussus sp. AFM4]
MGEPPSAERVVEHLEVALAAEDAETKNYHIRQALQLLGIE